jgi:hypothetical protein
MSRVREDGSLAESFICVWLVSIYTHGYYLIATSAFPACLRGMDGLVLGANGFCSWDFSSGEIYQKASQDATFYFVSICWLNSMKQPHQTRQIGRPMGISPLDRFQILITQC